MLLMVTFLNAGAFATKNGAAEATGEEDPVVEWDGPAVGWDLRQSSQAR